MNSPLEKNPKLLEKIGLYIVLFNLIDVLLGIQFYYIIDQTKNNNKKVINYLQTLDYNKKVDILSPNFSKKLSTGLKDINNFRVKLAHSVYGSSDDSSIFSIIKINKGSARHEIMNIDETILEKEIQKLRGILKDIQQSNYSV
jgi:hypothetical protein